LLGDAAMLLDAALNPLDVKPPPTTEETVARHVAHGAGTDTGGPSLHRSVSRGHRRDAPVPGADDPRPKRDPAARARAREAVVPDSS
jgi:hypothetical protein